MTPEERVALHREWCDMFLDAHPTADRNDLTVFLAQAFGIETQRRWIAGSPAPGVPDETVIYVTEAAIARIESRTHPSIGINDIGWFLGKGTLRVDGREDADRLVASIADLFRDAEDAEFARAVEHHRVGDLAAYLLHKETGIDMEYTRAMA